MMNPVALKKGLVVFVLGISAVLSFFHLGHSALWDDEATTALFGQSVWRAGDTLAVLDHNIIAYRNGAELANLRGRYIPPLQFYLVAPFSGLFPGSAFWARLPFALCGLGVVAVMLAWLLKQKVSTATLLLAAAGILGNVSLFLFARQCRYYAPAMLLTALLFYLYSDFLADRKKPLLIVLVSVLLFAANYMAYIAAYACLAVDDMIWGRSKKALTRKEAFLIVIPQLILCGLIFGVHNSTDKQVWEYATQSWLRDRVTLLWWNLRDLNGSELGVGLLILACPGLYFFVKNKLLLRAPLAIFIYVFVIALLSPQPILNPRLFANVRYLAPVIPLCIFTAVLCIKTLSGRHRWLMILLALLAFGTNIVHGGPLVLKDEMSLFGKILPESRFRSTITDYVRELKDPPVSAYREASEWINNNMEAGATVWVQPGFAAYPLMFHAPKAQYAWQVQEPSGQFRNLSLIHFEGLQAPDYIIAFGPAVFQVRDRLAALKQQKGWDYIQVERIDRYWYDLTRPELFWHTFTEIRDFSRETQGIYIFKRTHACPI